MKDYLLTKRSRITIYLILILFVSNIIMFFMIFNQNNEFNVPIVSPSMIAWGYWVATMVIGIRFWTSLNLFEKIVLALGFLSILNIWNDNLGFLFSQKITGHCCPDYHPD